MSPDQPPVAAAVIVHAGHVLLVRRRIPEGSLVWQLPAGKIQPGESAEQAAVRETREETGLIVAALRALGQRAHPATGRTMVYVACDVLAGTAHAASPVEVAALVWAGPGELAGPVPDGFYEPVQRHLDQAMAL